MGPGGTRAESPRGRRKPVFGESTTSSEKVETTGTGAERGDGYGSSEGQREAGPSEEGGSHDTQQHLPQAPHPGGGQLPQPSVTQRTAGTLTDGCYRLPVAGCRGQGMS